MKQLITINQLKLNDNNPRFIKDERFKKLVKSIKDFPEMLEKRPIIVDENMIVLGGNMRLRACEAAGLKEVWVDQVTDWSEEQKKEFIIKDNIGFGEWDFDLLANEWEQDKLLDWGFEELQFLDDNNNLILEEKKLLSKIQVIIDCENILEQKQLYEEFKNRGLKCQVFTL